MNLNEEVSPEFYFHLADGRVIKSVPELLEVMLDMDKWVWEHHVTKSKNDFVNWINDIYKNYELGTELIKAKKLKKGISVIEKALKKNEKQQKKEQQRKQQENQEKKSKKIVPLKRKADILRSLRRFE